jgi:hypothetical protein
MVEFARRGCVLAYLCLIAGVSLLRAEEPLPGRIDALILAKAGSFKPAEVVDDAGFLRRIYLDLAGRIPTAEEARAFLSDNAADKRAKLIDQLLASSDYPRHMQQLFQVMLMERRADDPQWAKYLESSFAANKPWDVMCRELLNPDPANEATLGSSFFYTKRLENYGQNPVDYAALTRDVGRLFLGVDLQCAQCHNHLFIDDYKQQDFQGLFIVYNNLFLRKDKDLKFPAVGEKPLAKKAEFMSVFDKVSLETGPRLPFGSEIEIPAFEKGEEWLQPPDKKTNFAGTPKFSPLAKIAEQLPTPENAGFARNIVNRLWFVLMGRGLVHPLDQHHHGNPPSHPEVLDLLAGEFTSHKFDIKWLLGELARTQTYQRASVLPEGQTDMPPEKFLVAVEKRLLAEQLMEAMLVATGERPRYEDAKKRDELQKRFAKAFANPPMEPEEEFAPSLQGALFVLNDSNVLEWLNARENNLADRLSKISEPDALADELYISVLSRQPSADERQMVLDHLAKLADRKPAAVSQLIWALLAATEFCVNH